MSLTVWLEVKMNWPGWSRIQMWHGNQCWWETIGNPLGYQLVSGQQLTTVKQFKYLGAIIGQDGSMREMHWQHLWWHNWNQSGKTKSHPRLLSSSVCMQVLASNSRAPNKDPSCFDEILQTSAWYFLHWPYHEWRVTQESKSSNKWL